MVMLLVLGSGWSALARAAVMPDAQHDEQVSLVGESRESPRVTTNGSNMALRNALRLVVPVDYSINLPNAGVWAATPVSWTAGHSLVQTLRNMLSGHPELAAQVDTDFQLVTVRYRQPFGADTVGTLPPVATATSPAVAASDADAMPPIVGGPLTGNVSTAPLVASSTNNGGIGGIGSNGGNGRGAAPVAHSAANPVQTSPASVRVNASAAADAPALAQLRLTSKAFATSAGSTTPVDTAAPATQAERSASELPVTGTAAHASDIHAKDTATHAALPVATPPPTPPLPTWRIQVSDRTIRAALTRWAQQAGWQLIWEAPVDFSVDAPASLTGTFDDALQSVVAALAGSNAPVQAILYRGNKVLRIVEKGAS
jgi:hypothetical protein